MSVPEQMPRQVDDQQPQFEITRKGYHQQQVNERLGYLTSELRAAESALNRMQERAEQAEAELRLAKREQVNAQNEHSFGFRVEKILRMAEEEARDVRAQAKTDAEAHRASVEKELAARTVAIEEQEQQLVDKRTSVEQQLQALRAQAERDANGTRVMAEQQANTMREQAQAECEQLRRDTETELGQRRTELEQQIAQLTSVLDQTHGKLRRVHDELGTVLGRYLEADSQATHELPATEARHSA